MQRPSRLDAFRDQIHEWFLACRGHCPVVLRKIQSELGVSISLRQLQKYCQPWRTKELHRGRSDGSFNTVVVRADARITEEGSELLAVVQPGDYLVCLALVAGQLHYHMSVNGALILLGIGKEYVHRSLTLQNHLGDYRLPGIEAVEDEPYAPAAGIS